MGSDSIAAAMNTGKEDPGLYLRRPDPGSDKNRRPEVGETTFWGEIGAKNLGEMVSSVRDRMDLLERTQKIGQKENFELFLLLRRQIYLFRLLMAS